MEQFFNSIDDETKILILILTRFIGLIISGLTIAVTTMLLYQFKNKVDIYVMKNENEEISEAVKNKQFIYTEKEEPESKDVAKNVISMMTDNVSELREYYVISKQQARKSFSAALFICFFGIIIYLLGIICYMIFNKDISVISIVGGTIVEVIAGLFFWLYRGATKQLGVYHQRLGSTEKYLTVIQIIKEIPKDNQLYAYNSLIASILSDNQEIIRHEK